MFTPPADFIQLANEISYGTGVHPDDFLHCVITTYPTSSNIENVHRLLKKIATLLNMRKGYYAMICLCLRRQVDDIIDINWTGGLIRYITIIYLRCAVLLVIRALSCGAEDRRIKITFDQVSGKLSLFTQQQEGTLLSSELEKVYVGRHPSHTMPIETSGTFTYFTLTSGMSQKLCKWKCAVLTYRRSIFALSFYMIVKLPLK